MNKKILISGLSVLLFSISCKKNDKLDWNKNIFPTISNLSGIYALKGARWGDLNVFDNSFPDANAVRPCDKDDIYRLNPDMTFKVSDIGIICTPSNTQVSTWDLVDPTTIRLNNDYGSIYYFDGNKLVIKYRINGNRLTVSFIKI